MRKYQLSTQIIIIALVSIILIPTLVYAWGFPYYKKILEEEIYESLDYQLTLTNVNDFMDSVFLVDGNGTIVGYDVKAEDENVPMFVITNIIKTAINSDIETGRGQIPQDDGSSVFYAYKMYGESGSVGGRILINSSFNKNTWFGNEKMGSFLLIMIAFSMIPILLILIWFDNVRRSIKSIGSSVADDGKPPMIASKELRSLNDSIDVFKRKIQRDTEEKQRLFQNISHELKTPITTIRMYAEGIEDGIFKDNDMVKSIEIIKDETANLLQRVNKIMEINKLYHVETSAIALGDEEINLSEVIFETLDLYSKRAPNVKFTTTLDRYDWKGTKEIWSNILQNIFDNNIKHGAMHIQIILNESQLIVENDGDKIEEEVLEKIFNPFIKGEKGNFGLGLNIVQRSLKILGCKIYVGNTDIGVKYHIEKR